MTKEQKIIKSLSLSLGKHLLNKGFSGSSLFSPMRTLDFVVTRYMKLASLIIKYLLFNKITRKTDLSIESIPNTGHILSTINRVWLRNAVFEWVDNNRVLLVLLYNNPK